MNSEQEKLLKRIVSVPGMLGGKPTIRGQRFLVNDVLELLASGLHEEDILKQHPILEKEDIQAALLHASLEMKNALTLEQSILAGYAQSEQGVTKPNAKVLQELIDKYR